MQNQNLSHRWFIWTIVFLIVSGVALVSYISLTGNDYSGDTWLTHQGPIVKQTPK